MVKKYFLILALLPLPRLMAQTGNGITGLQGLLEEAVQQYPSIKAKALSVKAAQAGIESSNKSFLPALDAAYQLNYATHNNISGMAGAQFFVPISGPPSLSNNYSPVFGTVTGLLFNWQPVSFGKQASQVAYSQAGMAYASADAANEIMQHKIRVSNTYLDILTLQEFEKEFHENILRAETNYRIAITLVTNGIKPGIDTAVYAAELSKARMELLGNQKNLEQAQIQLQQLCSAKTPITISDSSYFNKLPENRVSADTIVHPLLSLYQSGIELDKAKKNILLKTTSPSLNTWSTAYARGSGIAADGSVKSMDGLGLQRFNYGIGFQLSMPLLQSSRIKPQLTQQNFLIRADEEKFNESKQQLSSQSAIAEASFRYSLDMVHESRVLVSSSEYAYRAIVSRYAAGMANYADVIQAQYNLVKARTGHKSNYMAAWKALLFKAAVTGDLAVFLNQVK